MLKLSPAETKALTSKINTELQNINLQRHTGMPVKEITGVLVGHDLDANKVRDHIRGDEGHLHVQISDEIYFTMTWKRMESGRYEIVSYVSSQHDDRRDPYTTVMDSASKRKAKNKLNGLLEPINKTYHPGKAHAFGMIQDAIASCGLDWHEFEDRTVAGQVNGDDGRLHPPVSIGNGLFMAVTWHKMEPSGRYEITAYCS
jgi:hypothetical protein